MLDSDRLQFKRSHIIFAAECANPFELSNNIVLTEMGPQSESLALDWRIRVNVYDNHVIYDLGAIYLLNSVSIRIVDLDSDTNPNTFLHFSSDNTNQGVFEDYNTQSGQ